MDSEKKRWWETGQRPDYRFSLANERTFLAWIRTSLTLVAGGLAIHQFGMSIGPPAFRMGLVLALLLSGGIVGGTAYARWKAAEIAMRHQQDLPRSLLVPLLATLVPLIALGLGLSLLFS